MYRLILFLCLIIVGTLFIPKVSFSKDFKHVHLMHLDAVRGDLIKSMMEAGQLPFLKSLLDRGKISYKTTTVDKSETMKVILSYLSSRLDTDVVGWWQFNRNSFQYRNFWLNPVEVLNYALGLEFPLHPTIFDFLAYKNENIVSGFHLHRRSVKFNNYARAYLEGLKAVSNHTYFHQARATTDRTLEIIDRIAESKDEKLPALTTILLAALDEFGHIDGISQGENGSEKFCFDKYIYTGSGGQRTSKKNKIFAPVFEIIDEHSNVRKLKHPYNLYFTKLKRNLITGKTFKACIKLPRLKVYAEEIHPDNESSIGEATYRYSTPRPALSLIFYDMQLGKVINKFKSISVDDSSSLFDKTLFIVFGDHGLVDSKHMMARINVAHPDPLRHRDSYPLPFLEHINRELGLVTPFDKPSDFRTGTRREDIIKPAPVPVGPDTLVGVEQDIMPANLIFPHEFYGWKSSLIKKHTKDAKNWASKILSIVKLTLKEELYEKYSWLMFLRKILIDPKLNNAITPETEAKAINILTKLYLAGIPEYVKEEKKYLRDFYNRQVRLVYGGSARNNAEIFIPSGIKGSYSWDKRPDFKNIMKYAPGKNKKKLIDVLRETKGTGLIFIRLNNGKISENSSLPEIMNIFVTDRQCNTGNIQVYNPGLRNKLYFSYKARTEIDPLGYVINPDDTGLPEGGSYRDWNDLSIVRNHYYHNAVAGIGSILYSTNPAIGDVLVMHAQDWNFGGNTGGHGGLHRGEKLSFMIASGPGAGSGELMAIAGDKEVYPSLLDIIPTSLNWLGYGKKALTKFARTGDFKKQLERWVPFQKNDIIQNYKNMKDLKQALSSAGLEELEIEKFTSLLEKRLLNFMPVEVPKNLPDFYNTEEDGSQLILD